MNRIIWTLFGAAIMWAFTAVSEKTDFSLDAVVASYPSVFLQESDTAHSQTLGLNSASLTTQVPLPLNKPYISSQPYKKNIQKKPSLAEPKLSTTKYVYARRLNVRQNANKASQKIGQLTHNQKVSLIEVSGQWSRVTTGSQTGWVFSAYLTDTAHVSKQSVSKNSTHKKKSIAPSVARSAARSAVSVGHIRRVLIDKSLRSYIEECPCPYSITQVGKRCGDASAYSQAKSNAPLCYDKDITPAMISKFKSDSH